MPRLKRLLIQIVLYIMPLFLIAIGSLWLQSLTWDRDTQGTWEAGPICYSLKAMSPEEQRSCSFPPCEISEYQEGFPLRYIANERCDSYNDAKAGAYLTINLVFTFGVLYSLYLFVLSKARHSLSKNS